MRPLNFSDLKMQIEMKKGNEGYQLYMISSSLVQQRVRLFVITLSNPLPDSSYISKIKNIYFKWKFLSVLVSFL